MQLRELFVRKTCYGSWLRTILVPTFFPIGAALLTLLGAGTVYASAPTNGLVGYWKFDEGSGIVASDSSGSGYAGTVAGATWTAGKIGGALSFAGGSDVVKLPAAIFSTTDANQPYSASAWIKSTQGTGFVLSQYLDGDDNRFGLLLDVTGHVDYFKGGGVISGPVVTDGTWHHVAIVKSSGAPGGVSLFVDGIRAMTGSDPYPFAPVNTAIGATLAANYVFTGQLDDVRIYNRALSDQEVQAVYTDLGVPTPPTVSSFTASPSSIVTGASTTLSWATIGAQSISITPGTFTSTSPSGTLGVSPTSTITYTLTATNDVGPTTAQTTVTVTVPDFTPPMISNVSFSNVTASGATITWTTDRASDSQVAYGTTTPYNLSSTLNTALVINHSVTLSSLVPNTTYHYNVTSKVAGGAPASSPDATFSTTPPAPTISSFNASPTSIPAGGSSTLSWSVSGATSISIDQGVGDVTSLTSKAVTPNLSAAYTLSATNSGGSVTASATVTVTSASGSKLQAGPGKTVTLASDLILSGADTVDLIGSAANPCILQGNGHSILATDHTWNGHLTIQYCTIGNLGTITNDALDLSAVDNGAITIEHSTWDLSSSLVLEVAGNASVSFRYNLIPDTSLFPVSNGEPGQPYTRYCLQGKGTSTGSKVIAGNRIYKTFIDTLAATGWLIGGDTDADSNIVIGKRGGFYVGSGNVLRHNYSQALMPVDPVGWAWAQVTNVNTLGSGSLAEDNIINTGHWVTRGIDGEMRNNVILGVDLHMVQGGVGSIHHNIIAGGEPFPGLYNDPTTTYRCNSFIDNLLSSRLTVYNNTMDFRRTTGACAAVTVDANSFLPSLRSNVFFDLKLLSQWSAVDQGWGTAEFPRVTPYPARLGYTDYNAFYYDPNANVVNNYALAVAGKTLRTSAGYGLHDLQPGGPVNQSVDPQFRGPLPIDFPFSIDDIKAGIVTVSQMLTYFRSIYTPVTGSPLIGAQDPLDGPGDIGAVQSASAPAPYTTNRAPAVDPGPAITIAWPNNVINLFGYAGDDALPNGTLTQSWSQVSGPGTVAISPLLGFYQATFPGPGVYVLRLTASDGSLSTSADVTMTVTQ